MEQPIPDGASPGASEGRRGLAESDLRALFERAVDAILVVGADDRIRDVNPAATELLGFSRDELIGKESATLIHPDDLAAQPARLQEILAGAVVSIERDLVRKDGSIVPVEVRANRLDDGCALVVARDISRRRAAQATRRAMEERLRTVTDHAPIVLFATDREGRFLLSEGRALRALGLQGGEVVGRSVFDVYARYPEIIDAARRALSGERVSFEMTVGGVCFETAIEPMFDERGAVTGITGVSIDVTERVRAIEALRKSERRYRALAEQGWEVIVTYDVDSGPNGWERRRRTWASESVTRVFGYTVDEYLAAEPGSFVHPEDKDLPAEAARRALEAPGEPTGTMFRLRHRDGSWRWVESVCTNLLHDPDVASVVVYLRDVTDRKQAEDAVRRSERRYRALLEHGRDIVVGLTPNRDGDGVDRRIAWVSESIERVLGYTVAEARAQLLASFVHPDDWGAVDDAFKQTLAAPDQPVHVAYRARHKDGSWRWLESVVVNRLHNPAIGAVVAVSRDVTEQRHTEEQLRQAQKMDAIGRLAGGIAHDFNNMLTVILGYSGQALATIPPDSTHREAFEEIQNAAQRAADLTAQLLTFSRKQVLRPQRINLNDAVSSMEAMLQRILGQEITLVDDLDPDLRPIAADPGQISQVILNLVVNARDAMPGGGTVRIRTRNVPYREGDGVLLAVEDTGDGISAETLPHVFEPFFTTKEPGRGTGMGLATVHGIVAQAGGEITVESAPGEGSRFIIRFPAADGEGASAPGA